MISLQLKNVKTRRPVSLFPLANVITHTSRLWWIYMTEVHIFGEYKWQFTCVPFVDRSCSFWGKKISVRASHRYRITEKSRRKKKRKENEGRPFHLLKKKTFGMKGFLNKFLSFFTSWNLVKIMWKTRKGKQAVKVRETGIATTRISPTHSRSPHARRLVIPNARFENGWESKTKKTVTTSISKFVSSPKATSRSSRTHTYFIEKKKL